MKNHYKKLICSFVAVLLVGVIIFAALNYLVDPFGYFRLSAGYTSEYALIGMNENTNARLKTVYNLVNAPTSDTYQGLIVGGSKSMPITVELMENYTGLKYLSASASYGNFKYYEQIIQYALQHQQLKHIVLHLSGVEIWENPPAEGVETYRIPEVITTKNNYSIKDIFYYLFADLNNSVDAILNGSAPSLQNRFVVQEARKDRFSPIYQDNMGVAERLGISDLWTQYAHATEILIGMVRRSGYNAYYRAMQAEGGKNQWVENNVQNAFGIPYAAQLAQLFLVKKNLINKDENIQHLRNIVNLCNAYNVELTLVLGSTFLIERGSYECPEYWDYLHQIVQITDFYDFSYFCDINMNPCNFYNPSHYLEFIGIVMIDNLYGDGVIPFGQKVTAENFDEYIAQRQSDYYALEREYLETGTVQLPGVGDESDLSSLPGEFWLELLSRAEKNAA